MSKLQTSEPMKATSPSFFVEVCVFILGSILFVTTPLLTSCSGNNNAENSTQEASTNTEASSEQNTSPEQDGSPDPTSEQEPTETITDQSNPPDTAPDVAPDQSNPPDTAPDVAPDVAPDQSNPPDGPTGKYANVTWSGEIDGQAFKMTYCKQGVGPSDNVTMQTNGAVEIRCSMNDAATGIYIVSLVTMPTVGTFDHKDVFNPAVYLEFRSHNVPPVLKKVEGWKIATPTKFSVSVTSWDATTGHIVGSLDIDMTSSQKIKGTVNGTFDAYVK